MLYTYYLITRRRNTYVTQMKSRLSCIQINDNIEK